MVYVQNHLGQPLMPTQDHRKVRLLLKAGAEPEGDGAPAGDGEKGDSPQKKPPRTKS